MVFSVEILRREDTLVPFPPFERSMGLRHRIVSYLRVFVFLMGGVVCMSNWGGGTVRECMPLGSGQEPTQIEEIKMSSSSTKEGECDLCVESTD